MNKSGIFISLEGLDGSGKSSIAQMIKTFFERTDHDVILTREPGGYSTKICEEIRNMLLDEKNEINDVTEVLLFAASRAEHVNSLIIPSLNEGKIVICDRYIDSSLVYQGYAKKLGIDKVLEINKFAINNLFPDITFYLKIDIETYKKRIMQRDKLDRLDISSLKLGQDIIDGYDIMAKKYSDRIICINANKELHEVFEEIMYYLKHKGILNYGI